MIKKIFKIVLLLLLVGGPVLFGKAQEKDIKWAIKPSYSLLQYHGELGNQFFSIENRSDGASLAFSRYLDASFDVQLGIDYYHLNLKGLIDGVNYDASGHLFSPGFLFTYKFYNGKLLSENSRFKPYAGAGFSFMLGESSGTSHQLGGAPFSHFIDEISLNVVAGIKSDLSRRIAVFAEIDGVFATTEEIDGAVWDRKNDRFGGARIGFYIKLGGEEDDDNDGVPNSEDECPDTPPGVKVDEKGCPLDTDNDGIPDFQDDCPDEPGLPEYNGCPDTDGDGIIDKEDDCPELPGIPEYNGCPDSDGDGVIDPDDLCPDTQPGVVVDEYGCPIDSDGDGLTDDVDQCPDEYGPMEYMGCPEPPDVGWPPMEKETTPEIYFETDEYELGPEAEEEMNVLVKYLFENPMMNIRLYGFADPRGTKEYNAVLSARRVEAVKKYLMRKGVPENRIMVKALGEIQEVKTAEGEENQSIDQKYRKARKVQFETFFFMR
ncbi:OmpA family protein [Roseimarinus sediminis]|uniref:OmpA family protein n=1 Tax=Roseimarinus sediminis TaxID=1610899 RepID=UPI003D2628AB